MKLSEVTARRLIETITDAVGEDRYFVLTILEPTSETGGDVELLSNVNQEQTVAILNLGMQRATDGHDGEEI